MNKLWQNHPVIAIIGLSKNAGKTTTMNAFIESTSERIALTSIGLDGEDYDQITALPKPQVTVKKGMIIATALDTLKKANITFKQLELLPWMTALGQIAIIEVQSEGKVLLAGPATSKALTHTLKVLKKYCGKIIVDGAFNRKTLAYLDQFDGIVLAVGASHHMHMQQTLDDAKSVITQLQFNASTVFTSKPTPSMIAIAPNKTYISDVKNINRWTEWMIKTPHITHSYIRGAFTENWVKNIVKHRIQNLEFILDDATKLLIDHKHYQYMQTLNIRFTVIKPVNLMLITLNPYSVYGTSYDPTLFLATAKTQFNLPVIDVIRGGGNLE